MLKKQRMEAPGTSGAHIHDEPAQHVYLYDDVRKYLQEYPHDHIAHE